jgi:hypothetical protein
MNRWIFSTTGFVAANQMQVSPTNLVDIEQYFHDTGVVWETIGNQSQKHLELLSLA